MELNLDLWNTICSVLNGKMFGFSYCEVFKPYFTVLFFPITLLNISGIIFLDFSDPVGHVFIMEDWGSSLKACNTQLWGKS